MPATDKKEDVFMPDSRSPKCRAMLRGIEIEKYRHRNADKKWIFMEGKYEQGRKIIRSGNRRNV